MSKTKLYEIYNDKEIWYQNITENRLKSVIADLRRKYPKYKWRQVQMKKCTLCGSNISGAKK